MNVYTATFPLGADPRDIYATSLANLPSAPDFPQAVSTPNVLTIQYITIALTPGQITTWQTAVAATVTNPNAPWHIQEAQLTFLQNALSVLTTMQSQLTALTDANYADYGTANLANLNDVKHKLQAVTNGVAHDGSGGLAQLVTGLKNVIRTMLGITDGST